MTTMSNDLGVTVDANVTPYERGVERAKRSTQSYERSLESLDADIKRLEKSLDDEANKALQRHENALDRAGKAVFTFGAISAAGFALSANEAIKWESQWAGVTKTVDGSTTQMAELEDQLRQLALVLPASHEEIAATAEAAGQLGVQRQNVAAFTKVMLDLGNTTNLSAEQAATSLAQLMNIMETAPDLVDEIGNTLVALGNKGASTEADIVNTAMRVAGAVKLIGGTEADVLALSSALANLGIQAELGGGATQRVLLEIFQIMKEGGDDAQRLAELSGTSAKKFAAAWANDPVRAFDMVIKGLGRVQDSGGNVIQVLEELGIKGTQNLNVMLRLAGSGDVLTTALDDSRDAWERNNALIVEAGKRYETTESKVLMARNQLRDTAIDIGAVVLPVIAQVVETTGDMLRTWQDLPGPVRNAIVVIGLVATAMALAGGAALIAVPKIAAFKRAVDELDSGRTKSAGKGIMALGSFLSGPWGLALGVATIGLGMYAAKQGEAAREVEELTDTLDKQSGAITDNTREWMINKLEKEGILQAGRDLGIDLGVLTDAMLGNKEALALVNDQLALYDEHSRVGLGAAAGRIRTAIGGNNETLEESRTQWERHNEAMGGSEAAAEGAAGAQGPLQGTLGTTADLAGEAAEEIKSLGEELEELSGSFLTNREAGRATRDTLREIRRATREYIKEHDDLKGAFDRGTKSGDEFQALLDQLAQDYQNQIEATENLTGSEKRTMAVYRESRERLIEVATQLGLTKKEARAYAEQVLGTPEMVKTHFETPGLASAHEGVGQYAALFGNIPREVTTRFYTIHEDKLETGGHSPTSGPSTGGKGSGKGGASPATRTIAAGTLGQRLLAAGASRALAGSPRAAASSPFAGGGTLVLDGGSVDQLAAAMARIQPLYGPVSVSGDPTTFRKQMEDDYRAANAGALR